MEGEHRELVSFVRRKDFVKKEELGRGGCGITVKLYDDIIDENFVCKKYAPCSGGYDSFLFDKFIYEIKLLHSVNHINVVRVFNYYLYPEIHHGYILMEWIDGLIVKDYLSIKSNMVNDVFIQCVDGFRYLHKIGILHRDLRPSNVMVTHDGVVKIIDFGFGKKIKKNDDFDKSISLNMWCEKPEEFDDDRYDNATEVYFMGKLFEKIISELNIDGFMYSDVLKKMCSVNRVNRANSFDDVKIMCDNNANAICTFSDVQKKIYQEFANNMLGGLKNVEKGCKFSDNWSDIVKSLNELYIDVSLETYLPQANRLIRCFVIGEYYFKKDWKIPVELIKKFIDMMGSLSGDKVAVVMRNLRSRYDSIPSYSRAQGFDDVPF